MDVSEDIIVFLCLTVSMKTEWKNIIQLVISSRFLPFSHRLCRRAFIWNLRQNARVANSKRNVTSLSDFKPWKRLIRYEKHLSVLRYIESFLWSWTDSWRECRCLTVFRFALRSLCCAPAPTIWIHTKATQTCISSIKSNRRWQKRPENRFRCAILLRCARIFRYLSITSSPCLFRRGALSDLFIYLSF